MAERGAAGQVEAALVQRADHRAAAHDAVGERATCVRAGALHREPAVGGAEDRDLLVAHARGAALAGRHVAHAAYAHRHDATPAIGSSTGSPRLVSNCCGW